MRTVRDVLTKALSAIDERGWTKGVYEDKNGCLCSLGAVNYAVHGDPDWDSFDDAGLLHRSVELLRKFTYGDEVYDYNDDDSTQLEDVRDMFLKAIKEA